jgi:hypothetical protein
MGFQGTGRVVLPDDRAYAPKHIPDTHKTYAYNRYCACIWYKKMCPDVLQNAPNRKL